MKRTGLGAALAGLATSAVAASMIGLGSAVPAYSGERTPRFRLDEPRVERDGLGRKVNPKKQPRHNAKKRTKAWRDYADRVVTTHSDRPDPRDGKYLHSHARSWRVLREVMVDRRVSA